ncbi:hypothetical protein ABNavy71_161 [Acinetobacter phage AB-Navy71]|nr:hypothetical protein ABNavy71_161 [Acinetobacter phage AB-Navy71]
MLRIIVRSTIFCIFRRRYINIHLYHLKLYLLRPNR